MQYSFEDWLAEGGHAAMRFALNKSYSRVAWVYSCINAIATAASGAPLAFYKGSVDSKSNLITDLNHPVFTLFNPPKSSSIISFRELIYRTFILLGIDGIAYWVFERQNDIPVNVELKRKGQIVPIIKGDPINGVLLGYKEVKRFGEKEHTYKIKDVVPISFFNPDNPWSGLSPLTASRLSIETEYNIGGWNSAFFKNGLKVPLILQAQRALTPDQKKEIRKEVQNYYSGIDGTQGAFLASGVEAKPTILNPKDLDFIEGKKLNREEICSVFGVPPAIVGIFEYSNFSNTKEQRKIFWENTLLPKMQMIADLIQINLLNLDFPGIRIKWNLDDISALRTDPIEVANAAKIYADIGVPLLNISRLLNLPELEPGKDWKYSRFDLAPKRERQQNNRQPKLPATTDNGNPRPNKPPRSTDDEQVDNNNAVAIENLIDKVDEAILYFLKGLCDHKTLYLIVNEDVWLNTWDDLLDSKLELQNEFKDIIKASHILADFMITSDLKSLQNCIKSSRKFATLIVESIQQGLSEKRK